MPRIEPWGNMTRLAREENTAGPRLQQPSVRRVRRVRVDGDVRAAVEMAPEDAPLDELISHCEAEVQRQVEQGDDIGEALVQRCHHVLL